MKPEEDLLIKTWVRRLSRFMGVTFAEYDKPGKVDYLYLAYHGRETALYFMSKDQPIASPIVHFCKINDFQERINSALAATYWTWMKNPQKDQYGDPLPHDLVALPTIPFSVAEDRFIRMIDQADWYEDQTHHLLWVSFGQIPEPLWDSLNSCEDLGLEKPISYMFVDRPLHRWEDTGEFFSFYHA